MGADRACSCSTAEGMDGVGWLTALCVGCVCTTSIARSCVSYCVSHLYQWIAKDDTFTLVIWSSVKPGRARRLDFNNRHKFKTGCL